MTNKDEKIVDLATAIRSQDKSAYTIGDAIDKITEAKAEQIYIAKRTLAVAEHKITATLQGYIKAVASIHPLQTELELMITTFTANKNKQGIRKAEAANIVRTALHTPLKINFDGDQVYGHAGAKAVGTITQVEEKVDRIIGRAIVWNNEFSDVAEYIQSLGSIGTSWEIYYDPDKTVVEHGIEWLGGCVFAGLCMVENAAYGTEAIAKVI